MVQPPHSRTLSTLSGLGAIVLWSTTFAFARSLSEQVGAYTAAAAAYLIGGILCLVRAGVSPGGFRRFGALSRKYLFGCGALFAFYPAAIYVAIGLCQDRQQVLEVALVNYLWPTLTILFSIPLLHKRARGWLIPGTALAVSGVLLVMTQGATVSWATFRAHLTSNPIAYALTFAAAVAWGLYSNLARRWSEKGADGAVELFMPATGLVLLTLQLFVSEPTAWTTRSGLEAAGLGLITAVSYALWDLAMRRGNLLFVAACSYFTPLLSTFVSCVYLQVSPGPQLWLGCLLLIAGSLVTWRSVTD